MKTIFTLLLACFLAVAAFAADVAGRITVSFDGNKDYTVMIDGRTYYSQNNNRILLDDVRPGRHTIQVYKVKRNNQRNSQRSNKPVYSSSFVVRNQVNTHISIDRNGRVEIDERTAYDRDRKDNGYGRNDRDYGRNDRGDRDWDRDYGNDNGNWNNGYNKAMSEYEFNDLLQKIRNQWIGKLGTARDAVSKNYFTTQQVRQILQIFSSESDKLELAKLSYKNVVDKQSFRQLYDLFSYNAQADLDRYIRDYRY